MAMGTTPDEKKKGRSIRVPFRYASEMVVVLYFYPPERKQNAVKKQADSVNAAMEDMNYRKTRSKNRLQHPLQPVGFFLDGKHLARVFFHVAPALP